MIKLELTDDIKKWLDTPPDQRDNAAGAMLLLRVSRNRILYDNIMRSPVAKAPLLEYQLQKILKKRLADITHEQVGEMMVKVNAIADRMGFTPKAQRSEFQKGKRADHDELPPEVQQLYVDNAEIRRRMRDTHTKLRLISPLNSTCPDNDRFPLAQALIEYDTRYRHNWNVYDHYVKGTPVEATVLTVDPRTEQRNHVKTINLLLGKYAKNPNDDTAKRIKEIYAKIASPSDTLQAKMEAAALL